MTRAQHHHAAVAVRAAALRKSIGPWAALRFVQRRGCPARLFHLACTLRAANLANFGE